MTKVKDLLAVKGTQVYSIGPDADVLHAAQLMNEHKIGSLVVIDGEGHVAGMFTERDVMRRVVVERRDPVNTKVNEVMTSAVVCCQPESSVDELRSAMRSRKIRHLPVVDAAGKLAGLISIGDINAHQAHDQEMTIHMLNEYLHGRA